MRHSPNLVMLPMYGDEKITIVTMYPAIVESAISNQIPSLDKDISVRYFARCLLGLISEMGVGCGTEVGEHVELGDGRWWLSRVHLADLAAERVLGGVADHAIGQLGGALPGLRREHAA